MLDNSPLPGGSAGSGDPTHREPYAAPAWQLPAQAAPGGGSEPNAMNVPVQPARPGRGGPSLRLGIVAGIAALVVAGTAITMAAAPSAGAPAGLTAAATAAPSPAATAAPETRQGPGPGGMMGGRGFGKGAFPGMGGPMFGAGPMSGGRWMYGGMGGRMRGGPAGTISITAVDGDSISLKTDDGWTRSITVTSSTTITKAGATITAADLAVGDTVRFTETRNSDGSYTVNTIVVVVPQAAGSVTELTANGFTIKGRDGLTRSVTVDAKTAYSLDAKDGTKADVTVGADVIVAGPQASDGSITALHVTIILPRVAGTVGTTSADGFTITERDGTKLTVHVDSGTTLQVAGRTNPTLADITAGMGVFVTGTQRSDGSLDAATVLAGNGGFRHGPGSKGPGGNGPVPSPSASPSTNG